MALDPDGASPGPDQRVLQYIRNDPGTTTITKLRGHFQLSLERARCVLLMPCCLPGKRELAQRRAAEECVPCFARSRATLYDEKLTQEARAARLRSASS